MHVDRERVRTTALAVVREVRRENLTFMAGSIAYHAFVSLLPLLVLVVTVLAAVGDGGLETAFVGLTRTVLTPGASDVLVAELRAAGTSASVSALGLVVLVWGTLRIFRGLDQAFSDIYESEAANPFFDQVADGLLVLLTVGVAVVGGIAASTLLPDTGLGAALLRRLVFVVGLVVVFYPMYYLFPDEDVTPLEVLPGTVLTAVGVTVFESLFRLYLTTQGDPSVVGGILLLLTWLYANGLVILLGAAVNAVLANRSADVDVDPWFGGVSRTEKAAERVRLRERLAELRSAMETGHAVGVSVDGRETALDRPGDVRVEETADGVALVLAWRTPGDRPGGDGR